MNEGFFLLMKNSILGTNTYLTAYNIYGLNFNKFSAGVKHINCVGGRIMELLLKQIETFFVMLAYGLLGGLVFNLYQYILNKFNFKKIWINITDIALCLIMGLTGFGFLIFVNKGELRFYVLIAIVLGFILYHMLKKMLRYFI